MSAPLWSTSVDRPDGSGLTMQVVPAGPGVLFVFATSAGRSVRLTFDQDEAVALRDALDRYLDGEPHDGAAPGQDPGAVTDPHRVRS